MSAKSIIPVLYAAALALGACAANDSVSDPAPVVETTVLDPPTPSAENQGYLAVRPDPHARGLRVRAVNLTATPCADGTSAPECEVTALDLKSLGLTAEAEKYVQTAAEQQQLIVRGQVGTELVVREAWVGAAETGGVGRFARVTSTGIVCVAAPCPSLHAAELNTSKGMDLAALDFAAASVSPRQVEGAQAAVREQQGLIVAATTYNVTGPAGSMPGYLVNQFYLPVTGLVVAPPRPTDCYVGGCSSELCTDDPDAMSGCIFKPENECFRAATCERQPDLRCGWTPSDSLRACLANPPALE